MDTPQPPTIKKRTTKPRHSSSYAIRPDERALMQELADKTGLTLGQVLEHGIRLFHAEEFGTKKKKSEK